MPKRTIYKVVCTCLHKSSDYQGSVDSFTLSPSQHYLCLLSVMILESIYNSRETRVYAA